MPGPFKTIAEIKAANAALGHFWFSPETIKFFGTKIMPTVVDGRYFITSEQPPHGPRKYSVRRAEDNGSISTVGKFCHYPTRQSARRALTNHLRGIEEDGHEF